MIFFMMHKNHITPQTMGDPIFMFFSSLGIKRKRWTEEEERELAQAFSRQIEEKSTLSTSDIRNAQKRSKILSNRSEAVIRSKINNIVLGKTKLQVH
jgi:hypothetical protein